jgi:hypothetical protein
MFVIRYIGAGHLRLMINATSTKLKVPVLFNGLLYVIPVLLLTLTAANLFNEFQQFYGGYPFQYIVIYGLVPLCVIILGSAAASRLTRS